MDSSPVASLTNSEKRLAARASLLARTKGKAACPPGGGGGGGGSGGGSSGSSSSGKTDSDSGSDSDDEALEAELFAPAASAPPALACCRAPWLCEPESPDCSCASNEPPKEKKKRTAAEVTSVLDLLEKVTPA